MRLVACCLFSCMLLSSAAAQGFNTLSGRNHPELDWQVAATPHFEIMYPAHLRGIEAEAAPIAEATYAALSANLGVTFNRKIRIYLSDEDEITNGFAVPLGNGYTNIWVHPSDVADVWTGREKWLRKVVAHELAHIFHYRAVRARPRLLNFLLGDPLPRFWTEGLAQYETERWDAQRGDRWLRAAVLDDALSYRDGRSIWNGRLLYALGNAQVRYFAEQYGDTTLARLLAHRKKVLFGLARVHDFDTAFEAVTDRSYRTFYDAWRRHVNVYYNTLAGQLEPLDSLEAVRLDPPGQYLYDLRYSPDTTRAAVLALPSLRSPVRRLYVVDRARDTERVVAEGAIKAPFTWSPDGTRLAFARTTRGRQGSLLNDLFLVGADGEGMRRLTYSRRASAPAFAPGGQRLAFAGSAGGTANVFVLDLETGTEMQLTHFEGDVQLSALRWHPGGTRLAVARFAADGTRDIVLLDPATSVLEPVTSGRTDDRLPVWRPDGTQLAYTSLRDGVPNVFVYDLAAGTHRRVTYLATGATAHDWLPPDSARATGTLLVTTAESKARDRAYRVDAAHSAPDVSPQIPAPYTGWTLHRPPRTLPSSIPPDSSLITARYPYSAWRNLTHAASLPLPYYFGPDDWGVLGFTSWVEPLAKHLFFLGGAFSLPRLWENSVFLGTYVNNQARPSLNFNVYSLPASFRFYSTDLLVEAYRGGDVTMRWPLDWTYRPFVTTTLDARLRYVDIDPLNLEDFDASNPAVPPPQPGQQADLRVALTVRQVRPNRDVLVHPLDGRGLRARLTGAARVFGADDAFLRGDLAAYHVVPAFGRHRLYLYGRAQAQTGTSLPQDFIGLPSYDDVQLFIPGFMPFTLAETDRVRGYRDAALGDRMLFGSLEYRLPLLASLETRALGFLSLGSTALAAFVDAGLVWNGGAFDAAERRTGLGLEVKNALRIGGFFQMGHALGLAQPAADLGRRDRYEVYYRIRAALPF